jgi:hypothetical protein
MTIPTSAIERRRGRWSQWFSIVGERRLHPGWTVDDRPKFERFRSDGKVDGKAATSNHLIQCRQGVSDAGNN